MHNGCKITTTAEPLFPSKIEINDCVSPVYVDIATGNADMFIDKT